MSRYTSITLKIISFSFEKAIVHATANKHVTSLCRCRAQTKRFKRAKSHYTTRYSASKHGRTHSVGLTRQTNLAYSYYITLNLSKTVLILHSIIRPLALSKMTVESKIQQFSGGIIRKRAVTLKIQVLGKQIFYKVVTRESAKNNFSS